MLDHALRVVLELGVSVLYREPKLLKLMLGGLGQRREVVGFSALP